MKQKTSTVVLATALSLGGLTAGLVLAPAIASAATTQATTTEAVSDRLTKIKESLAGLVTDGTITQAQADQVATTLDEALPRRGGPGGHGPGGHAGRGGGARLDAAADAIGLPEAELRTALKAGQSLTQVAEGKGVSRDALIASLTETAKARLAEEVTEGDLTQAQADQRLARLTDRLDEVVDREGLPGRGGKGGGAAG